MLEVHKKLNHCYGNFLHFILNSSSDMNVSKNMQSGKKESGRPARFFSFALLVSSDDISRINTDGLQNF